MSEARAPYRQIGEQQVMVTYLKLSPLIPSSWKANHLLQVSQTKPSLHRYRQMFHEVGHPWNWTKRKLQTDEQVRQIIHSHDCVIVTLLENEQILGFCEFHYLSQKHAQVEYLGLKEAYVGKGYGKYLLSWALNAMVERGIEDVTLHTSTLDCPIAISFYQSMGFVIERTVEESDPILSKTGGGFVS